MDFLPIFMNIRGQRCLVVGGGEIAARKAALLQEAGAEIAVVSPELSSSMARQAEQGSVTYREGAFEASDLDGVNLVIAATDDEAVNRQVSELARTRQLPVNVVDNPELCSFIIPSIIDRSPV